MWTIQKFKGAGRFPWLTANTDLLNRVVAVILAAASASGIIVVYGWSGSTFTLTASGLTLEHGIEFAWAVMTSTVIQELIYRSSVKK